MTRPGQRRSVRRTRETGMPGRRSGPADGHWCVPPRCALPCLWAAGRRQLAATAVTTYGQRFGLQTLTPRSSSQPEFLPVGAGSARRFSRSYDSQTSDGSRRSSSGPEIGDPNLDQSAPARNVEDPPLPGWSPHGTISRPTGAEHPRQPSRSADVTSRVTGLEVTRSRAVGRLLAELAPKLRSGSLALSRSCRVS
jgi:hypothetical protein